MLVAGVLVTLVLVTLAPALGIAPWHGADAHSSMPHRGPDSPLSAADTTTRMLEPSTADGPVAWSLSEPRPLAGLLMAAAAFHPPR